MSSVCSRVSICNSHPVHFCAISHLPCPSCLSSALVKQAQEGHGVTQCRCHVMCGHYYHVSCVVITILTCTTNLKCLGNTALSCLFLMLCVCLCAMLHIYMCMRSYFWVWVWVWVCTGISQNAGKLEDTLELAAAAPLRPLMVSTLTVSPSRLHGASTILARH